MEELNEDGQKAQLPAISATDMMYHAESIMSSAVRYI